jgi:hypothetical protein
MSIWIKRVLIQQRKAEDNICRGADIYAREYKNITFCLSAGFCFLWVDTVYQTCGWFAWHRAVVGLLHKTHIFIPLYKRGTQGDFSNTPLCMNLKVVVKVSRTQGSWLTVAEAGFCCVLSKWQVYRIGQWCASGPPG